MSQRASYTIAAGSETERAQAVVLHCSDHRFQAGFREFLTDGLGIQAYALLAIPGGGNFIPLEQYLPKFAKAGLQSMSFLVKRSGPERIILIGHHDCLFFKERFQFFFIEADLNDKQRVNLRKARSLLRERFPSLPVEAYFADMKADGSVEFLEL
jgi:hypothetical protein